MNKFTILTFLFIVWACSTFAQKSSNETQEEIAIKELKRAMSDSTIHNVIDLKTFLLKDQKTALSVVEPILFSVYGKKNIIKQKPYKINLVEKYWIISGTQKHEKGGNFLIIIDATNLKILRLTHGK